MRLSIVILAALALAGGVPGLTGGLLRAEVAAPDAAAADLPALLHLDAYFELIAAEGAGYGEDVRASMFQGRAAAGWEAEVARIYAPESLRPRFDAEFTAALAADPAMVAEVSAFYGSDLGQRIVGLEIEARRVLLDRDATEAAEVAAEKMAGERNPRLRLIRALIEAGNLIEQNATSSMTGYLAFNAGLEEALPAAQRRPEEDLMSLIWAQESQMRADMTEWLVSYMVLAYAPLSDDELRAYAEFMKSDAAHRLNAALFAAYDAAFTPALHRLGLVAGQVAQGRDI